MHDTPGTRVFNVPRVLLVLRSGGVLSGVCGAVGTVQWARLHRRAVLPDLRVGHQSRQRRGGLRNERYGVVPQVGRFARFTGFKAVHNV